MNANDKAKKAQKIFILGGIVFVAVILIVVIKTIMKDAGGDEKKEFSWGFKSDEEKVANSLYVNKIGKEVGGIENVSRQQQGQNERQDTEIKKLKEQIQQLLEEKRHADNTVPGGGGSVENAFLNNLYEKYPAPVGQQQGRENPSFNSMVQTVMPQQKPTVYVEEYESNGITSDGGAGEVVAPAAGKPGASAQPSAGAQKKEEKKIFVPSTTEVRVVLVNGYNAPTLQNGENVLAPVVAKAVGDFILPNGKRLDFRGCNFQGEAAGKLSDKRSYPRMSTMACVDKDNNPINIPISAYLSDEFGTVGVQGNPVTLQNDLIEGALWASAISGFSNMAAQSNMSVTTSTTGTFITQPMDMANQFKSGAFGAIGKVGGRLEDFLFDNIKTLETVLEVKGRRSLVLHFAQGFFVYEDGSNYKNVILQTSGGGIGAAGQQQGGSQVRGIMEKFVK